MIVRTGQNTIDEYFESTAVSQSTLKKIAQGVEIFNNVDEKDLYYEEKGHFIIGNGVDVWLTQGANVFEQQFHRMLVKKPSDKMMSIIHRIFDSVTEGKTDLEIKNISLEHDVEHSIINEVVELEQYQPNWKEETKVKAVIREGDKYFTALGQAHGKQICSDDEWRLIHEIVNSFQENEYTGKFFSEDTYTGNTGYDIFYQLPIYFNIYKVECKALLDMVVVDHTKKTITGLDIKTMGDYTINFPKSCVRRRYDVQGAFYLEALRKAKMQLSIAIGYDVSQYVVEDFYFLVESTIKTGNPLIFKMDKELIIIGTFGRKEIGAPPEDVFTTGPIGYIRHNEILGFSKMLELYNWHVANGFDKDKVVVTNNGVVNLGWYKIY